MFDNLDLDSIAIEALRQTYTRFYTNFHTRRPTQAPKKFDNWDDLQLPTGACVHTINGIDTLIPPNSGLPDIDLPVIKNTTIPIYVLVNSKVAVEETKPFGVKDQFVYRPATILGSIGNWYQHHRRFKRILADSTISKMPQALSWVDYSPLVELQAMGVNHNYRKFDIILRTVIDKIAAIGSGVNHYILFPQGHKTFSRALLQRAYKELSNATTSMFNHDPSVFPLIHLLAYSYSKTNDLAVTPYKNDLKLLGKDSPELSNLKSTSLFDRLPQDLLDSMNVILYHGDQAVIYNLGDIGRFSEKPGFYVNLYRHFMILRSRNESFVDHEEDSSDHQATEIHESDHEEIPVVDNVSEPEVVKPKPIENKTKTVHTPMKGYDSHSQSKPVSEIKPDVVIKDDETHSSFEAAVRKKAEKKEEEIVSFDNKKKKKQKELIDNHFNATLGGKPLSELTQVKLDSSMTPKPMDFVSSAPEPSYQKSMLVEMDKTYLDRAYHVELGKVLGSTAKHGLYITKIEEEEHHTEMDHTTTVKVSLTDLDGKNHSIKFTRPTVSKDGTMMLSGTEYRLTRQATNLPICKISEYRVNLSSYYNKVIVERVQSKRNNYSDVMGKILMDMRNSDLIEGVLGKAPDATKSLPYDYSAIGKTFTELHIGNILLYFGAEGADLGNVNFDKQGVIPELSKKYGIFVGQDSLHENLVFWGHDNSIKLVSVQDYRVKDVPSEIIEEWKSFGSLLIDKVPEAEGFMKPIMEWTQAVIINQTIPLVIILGYEFGLENVFRKINLDYKFYDSPAKPKVGVDDIAIRFADGTLVFSRYPLQRSLIAGGLGWADFRSIYFRDMNHQGTYTDVLALKKMRPGVLKGINGFIDFFVDPITEAVLEKMHEPTEWGDLLLRANIMLSDYFAEDSSSIKLHRFRLYERFNGAVYNEIYKALANHRAVTNQKRGFSINPEAVFQHIVQDATLTINDTINPVHELKQTANFTFTGSGGRSAKAFVQDDRAYPKDGMGVVSDAVPDSGKVGITSYLSASPNINDIHGIPTYHKPGDELEPPQILSIGSMLMPGGTTDDGKRNSYLSIQISHYVPNHGDGETLAVRTGYDAVLPHLASDLFAISAEDDGVVESIDDKLKVVRVRYADKPIEALRPLKLPYTDIILDKYRQDENTVGYLIPEKDLGAFPMNGIFSLTRNTYGKIIDRLRCDSVDAIPDKDVMRKQSILVKDFSRGVYGSLYYLRIQLIGNRTPGEIKAYSYKESYSPISGNHLLQTRKSNFAVGEKVKRGDVIIYNDGFFAPDPLSKQVTFKHGVIATVALCEKGSNHEDACEITRSLSNRLLMTPCHQREIITKNDAALLKIVNVGDHVETSDPLCIISDDALVQSGLYADIANLDLMAKLNRQTPIAEYTGYIRNIRILYACEKETLSESLKTVLKAYEKEVRQSFNALNVNKKLKAPERPGYVKPGTRYRGVEFSEGTVLIEFMIEETLNVAEGDKLCFGNANKSIVSHVTEEPHFTESGVEVDALFSTTSIINRIVASPLSVGITERNMEEAKRQAVANYFARKK